MPPLDAWGDEALSLDVAEFLSGAVTSAYAALVTLDPDDDAAALELARLTSGFSFGASDPTAVAQGEGLSAADTLLLAGSYT